MFEQQEIDWNNPVHQKENNRESQSHLEENYEKFSEQCKKVYAILKSGIRLTVKKAVTEYGINSLPRRLKDLKDKCGVTTIEDRWLKDANGKNTVKEWFIETNNSTKQ